MLLLVFAILFASHSVHASDHASLTQVVLKAPTSVTLASGLKANSIPAGQTATFTAAVIPTKPTVPTGTVTFTAKGTNTSSVLVSDPVPLPAFGTATWSPTPDTQDTYSVLAAYSGDTNYQPSVSPAMMLAVAGEPDFTISTTSSELVNQGSALSLPLTLIPLNGFHGNVALSCTGLGTGMACSFGSSSLALPAPVSTSASTSSGQPLGSASTAVTISTMATTLTTLSGLFLLSLTPLRFGKSRRPRTRALIGYAGLSCLAVFVLGCGVGTHYEQQDGTPKGTYHVVITGTAGALTHSQTVTVQVK